MTKPKPALQLKAMYAVRDLAATMGMSLNQLRYFIEVNQIPTHTYGIRGKTWILLSDLKDCFPDLFESLLLAAQANTGSKRLDTAHEPSIGRDDPLPSEGSVWRYAGSYWRAMVNDGPVGQRKGIHLGTFDTEDEAKASIRDYRLARIRQKDNQS